MAWYGWTLLYFATLALSTVLAEKVGWLRPQHIIGLPMLALDCLGNMLTGGSWRNTLSGESWHHRNHKYWYWCHRAIDFIFRWQKDHCMNQALREARWGGVWPAWWHVVKTGRSA